MRKLPVNVNVRGNGRGFCGHLGHIYIVKLVPDKSFAERKYDCNIKQIISVESITLGKWETRVCLRLLTAMNKFFQMQF